MNEIEKMIFRINCCVLEKLLVLKNIIQRDLPENRYVISISAGSQQAYKFLNSIYLHVLDTKKGVSGDNKYEISLWINIQYASHHYFQREMKEEGVFIQPSINFSDGEVIMDMDEVNLLDKTLSEEEITKKINDFLDTFPSTLLKSLSDI